MISECISDDIPPQMKILNMAIPILMHFCSFLSIGALLVLGNYYFQLLLSILSSSQHFFSYFSLL